MGVGLGYQGTLNDVALLDALVADVRKFCEQVGWEYFEISDPISGIALDTAEDFMDASPGRQETAPVEEWPEEETMRAGGMTIRFNPKDPILLEETWRGIVANPPGTESLAFTFDGKGRLCHYMKVPDAWVKGPMKGQPHYMCFPLYCKTAGAVEQHVAICILLRMVRARYMTNLEVDDDTGYFKTGDEKKLRQDHEIMASFFGVFKESPAFLKTVMKAAGLDEKLAESAAPLPNEIDLPVGKATQKARKATVH